MKRCRCELSKGLQIWFHVKPRECGLAHRGETGRSTNDAKPGCIAQCITNYADIQLVTHPTVLTLGDVLYVSLRH